MILYFYLDDNIPAAEKMNSKRNFGIDESAEIKKKCAKPDKLYVQGSKNIYV